MAVELHLAGRAVHASVTRLLNDVYVGEGYIPATRMFDVVEITAWAGHTNLIVALDTAGAVPPAAGTGTATALVGVVGLTAGGSGVTRVAVEGEGEVQRLAVAAGARRLGVGEALVRECIRRSRAAGHRRLVLWTRPEMTAAQRLYERLGFRHEIGMGTPDPRDFQRLVYVFDFGSALPRPLGSSPSRP